MIFFDFHFKPEDSEATVNDTETVCHWKMFQMFSLFLKVSTRTLKNTLAFFFPPLDPSIHPLLSVALFHVEAC